jgi:hypothetical protein
VDTPVVDYEVCGTKRKEKKRTGEFQHAYNVSSKEHKESRTCVCILCDSIRNVFHSQAVR